MTKKVNLAAALATATILTIVAWCPAQLRLFGRETPLQTVVSGPFLFTTDLAPADVHALGAELLQLERRITSELSLPRLAVPVRVYLFQSKSRYQRFVKENFSTLQGTASRRRAFFLLRESQPHIFAHSSADLHGDLRHEFTHALLNTTVRGLPLWLDEGLAVFYQAPGESGLQPGHVAMIRSQLRRGHSISLDQLSRLTDGARMGDAEYAAAWSWAHFLLRGPAEVRGLLVDYCADLRSHTEADPIPVRLAQRLQDPYRSWVHHIDQLAQYR